MACCANRECKDYCDKECLDCCEFFCKPVEVICQPVSKTCSKYPDACCFVWLLIIIVALSVMICILPPKLPRDVAPPVAPKVNRLERLRDAMQKWDHLSWGADELPLAANEYLLFVEDVYSLRHNTECSATLDNGNFYVQVECSGILRTYFRTSRRLDLYMAAQKILNASKQV